MISSANKGLLKVILAVLGLASSAYAGDSIFLRSGTISTKGMSSRFNVLAPVKTQEAVVQFKTAITSEDKLKLSQMGVTVLRYLPEDAFVISGSASLFNALRQESRVQVVLPYDAQFKVSADFEGQSVFTAGHSQRLLIRTFDANQTARIANKIGDQSALIDIKFADGKAIVLDAPEAFLPMISELGGIEHIQPYVEMKLFDDPAAGLDVQTNGAGDYTDINGYEDGTKVMNFSAAWDRGFTGKNQIVAMADTGLDTGDAKTILADLKGAIHTGYAYGIFADSWNDPMGHGTHVAGSVLSRGTNSSGKIKGGAYDAKMVAQAMWSPVMDNLTVPPKLETMFKAAYADGAKIHTNSWGAARNFGAYDSYALQVDEFMVKNPEMLIVFAAGNSGVDKDKDGRIDPGSMSSPGTAKNCLTVGASENLLSTGGIQVPIKALRAAAEEWPADPVNSDYISNNINGVAMFSSRGPTLDGRVKPDVVAPGTNILSLKSQVQGASDMWGAYNKFYVYSGGTSMATPLVAGAAAVSRQYLETQVSKPSAAVMKAWLIHTAVDMYPGQFGEVGAARGQELLTKRPTSDAGYGRVDMAAATQTQAVILDRQDGIAQGAEDSVSVVTTGIGKVWATLVYTDAPASSNAAKTLVNDLDLVITTDDGNTVTKNDRTNNVEMVELEGVKAGSYKITVKGAKIPQGVNAGKQPYALVISGTGISLK